jgi:hypothetical protein
VYVGAGQGTERRGKYRRYCKPFDHHIDGGQHRRQRPAHAQRAAPSAASVRIQCKHTESNVGPHDVQRDGVQQLLAAKHALQRRFDRLLMLALEHAVGGMSKTRL